MKLIEISDYLESIAPLAYQESYDNAGLIVGNASSEVKKALICLDSTEEIVDEAISKGCNLIIAHHPIVFGGGLKRLNGKNYVERTIIKAIKNDISIYAVHTNLDNIDGGVSAAICKKIGLTGCKILLPKENLLRKLFTFCPVDKAGAVRKALFAAGCGAIGGYDECSFNVEGTGTFRGSESTNPYVGEKGKQHHEKEIKIETIYPAHLERDILSALFNAHPYEEVAYDIVSLENKHARVGAGMIGDVKKEENEKTFLNRVKKIMQTGCIRHTKLLDRKVKRVAVCGGAGSFLLSEAIANEADVFITSDFRYHQFFDAENKIVIADIGHYESERATKELLYEILNKRFPKFALSLSEINTNPVNYL